MRITHPSGNDYDLYPDTEIEVTRFNPFFHSLGEQSVPVSLPATSRNLQLLGNPDRPDNANKPDTRIDVTIQSGAFSIVGRQAILSVQAKGSIDTSFYLNEGAFYEKMSNLTLSEIFEDKKVEFASIDAAISFMYSLVFNVDPRFGVFPVITDNHILNGLTYTANPQGLYPFYNAVDREDVVDGAKISIAKGFYITPFVKVKHVLVEVFSYMGYSLGASFLDAAPFSEMVFLNDNLDTLMDNSINYVDIVPAVTVKTLLDVIRKFNIEFIPDEVNRVVNIIPFNHMIEEPESTNLTPHAVSIPLMAYHDQYKQIKLSSEKLALPGQLTMYRSNSLYPQGYTIQTGEAKEGEMPLFELLSKFPGAYVRKSDGAIIRDFFRGRTSYRERLGDLNIEYYAGGTLEAEEFSFPDLVPPLLTMSIYHPNGEYYPISIYPYVGKGRALRSKIVLSGEEGNEEQTDEAGDTDGLKPILCLLHRQSTHCDGTLSSYDISDQRIWDYSLFWNGEDGIFEKFWRKRDNLLRNALLELQADLLLPENLKLSIPSSRKVAFDNQQYLLSQLRYSTSRGSVSSCSLLSTKLQKPISEAPLSTTYFPERKYRWAINYQYGKTGTSMQYRWITEPVAYYVPDPTKAQYDTGGRYHQKEYQVEYGRIVVDSDNPQGVYQKQGETTLETWLEPALYQ